MKKIVAAAALALFGLAPAIGSACDYQDGSSASVNPIEEMAAASAPAASKAPASAVAKAPAQNAVKPVAVKVKRASDQKVASTTN